MKEFIEKLITRIMLESASCKVYKLINPNKEDIAEFNAYKKCIEIINELAEEYINTSSGWIPCSEELPEEDKIVLLCTKDKLVRQGVRHISYEHNRYDLYGVTSTFWDEDIVAWQPLPKPYKE